MTREEFAEELYSIDRDEDMTLPVALYSLVTKFFDDFESERANTVLVPSDKLKAMQKKIAEFKSRACNSCTHCDKSTLTELRQAYCNKLQTSIRDYDKFFCAYWKE